MKKGTILKNAVASVLLGSMMLAVGGVAMAGDSSSSDPAPSSAQAAQKVLHNNFRNHMKLADAATSEQNLQGILDEMVSAATITQDQANSILNYLADKEKDRQAEIQARQAAKQNGSQVTSPANRGQKTDMLSDLVTQGIITTDQANTLKAAIQQTRAATEQKSRTDRTTKVESSLNSLVTAGTITQDQANSIEQSFTTTAQNRKTEFEKMKDMTQADRSAYMQQMKTVCENPLQQLVTNNTITQAQADAIAKLWPTQPDGNRNNAGAPESSGTSAAL